VALLDWHPGKYEHDTCNMQCSHLNILQVTQQKAARIMLMQFKQLPDTCP
jgi:hypothetical protein